MTRLELPAAMPGGERLRPLYTDLMQLRRLGRTNLQVSVIGVGTSQLRLLSKRDAIATLERAFDLGVNIVHVAPDYEGALELVAKAVSGRANRIAVACQGYDQQYNSCDPTDHFERLFESTCETLRTETLDLFGIACIDDREAFRENVWGKRGMVEFLQQKKQEGRLRGIFCTTHGGAEYQKRLILSGVFDALMVAYNVLGFHLLSFCPPEGRGFEDLDNTRDLIFPLASQHDVGLMIMKALGGGLLCAGKALPAHHEFRPESAAITAAEALRAVLVHPEVSCVVAGMASLEEAEEDARAGIAPVASPFSAIAEHVAELRSTLCSRCGDRKSVV